MDHWPAKSSSIESYGYDPGKKELEIKYRGSGKIFSYANVPYDFHLKLQTAKSQGQFVENVIKRNHVAKIV